MGRTIIQPIGPLYGEAVNGTVFGRPNGSIYIPASNTIDGTIVPSTYDKIRIVSYGFGKRLQICGDTGTWGNSIYLKAVAQSQDTASNIRVHVEDGDGVAVGGAINATAGSFNRDFIYMGTAADDTALVADDPYTIVLELMSSSGVAVATDTISVTGWTE